MVVMFLPYGTVDIDIKAWKRTPKNTLLL